MSQVPSPCGRALIEAASAQVGVPTDSRCHLQGVAVIVVERSHHVEAIAPQLAHERDGVAHLGGVPR